ncbi:unnamed protein product [Musa acuminata subsp. malaccensis]|nr:unnamed protein product [Musa acuminata subsp. malaccensis]
MGRLLQSALCLRSASTKRSPDSPSLVSSSPLEQRHKDEPCDLLRDLGRCQSLYDHGMLGQPKSTTGGYYASGPVLTRHRLQAAYFYHLKRQQMMKQQLCAAWERQSKPGRPLDLSSSAWPPPLPASGMHAVFLNNSRARKESAGTGVFLPRTADNKLERRKRILLSCLSLFSVASHVFLHGIGCSTVLVPDRVVQALNLRLDEFAALQRFSGGFVLSRGK